MNLIKRLCLALVLLCLIVPMFLMAQIDTLQDGQIANYETPTDYEIGGLKVVGAKWAEPSALLNVAGLRVGDKIKIPGQKTSNSLKALWKLGLFEDVEIYQEKNIGEIVFLTIKVVEVGRLGSFQITGIKKSKIEELRKIVLQQIQIGRKLTEHNKQNARQAILNYYKAKGFSDVKIKITTKLRERENQHSAVGINTIDLLFHIEKGDKVKIGYINFQGNEQIGTNKLKKLLGLKTKGKLFANSKLLQAELQAGKETIIQEYQELGYLDATIVKDSIWRTEENHWQILLTIEEGKPYYFGAIQWSGNSIYSREQLSQVLGIQKGDRFNQNLLENRLHFSQEGKDISGLYMDNGYLFFRAEAIQQTLRKDTIDLVINILEGPQATIDKVIIKGNDITHEAVIRRELRTKPGQKFSRSALIRSQRALINLGYFNPENLGVNTPVNPKTGTVDIEYEVEEKSNFVENL